MTDMNAVAHNAYNRGVQDERQRVLNALIALSDEVGSHFEVEGRRWSEGASRAVLAMIDRITERKVPKAPDA